MPWITNRFLDSVQACQKETVAWLHRTRIYLWAYPHIVYRIHEQCSRGV